MEAENFTVKCLVKRRVNGSKPKLISDQQNTHVVKRQQKCFKGGYNRYPQNSVHPSLSVEMSIFFPSMLDKTYTAGYIFSHRNVPL